MNPIKCCSLFPEASSTSGGPVVSFDGSVGVGQIPASGSAAYDGGVPVVTSFPFDLEFKRSQQGVWMLEAFFTLGATSFAAPHDDKLIDLDLKLKYTNSGVQVEQSVFSVASAAVEVQSGSTPIEVSVPIPYSATNFSFESTLAITTVSLNAIVWLVLNSVTVTHIP